jgi:hypothetical protein
MKNCIILLFLLLSLAGANAQGREDFTADGGPATSSTKNLVLLIGSEHFNRTIESVEREIIAAGNVKYSGIQYLYLQNVTVFSGPVVKKSTVEIISQTKNRLVFRLPKVSQNVLEVDLGSVHESANQIGVQVATISFQ